MTASFRSHNGPLSPAAQGSSTGAGRRVVCSALIPGNTNTNYNPEAERRAGVAATDAVVRHLAGLLPQAAAAAA